jgi:predicted MFS family arabinose efflux permease
VAGFGYSCWAPLVPFAKQRVGADEHVLGLLLLCVGIGSLLAMPLAGALSSRYGSKPLIIAAGLGLAADLSLLPLAGTAVTLGAALFAFGATLGSLDVAMNLHAVEVERAADRPLMSGFHALFSIGGFAGAAFMTFLLSANWPPARGTLLCSALMVLALAAAWPGLLKTGAKEEGPLFVRPRGVVLLLAALAAVSFLAEGALLDWGALLITNAGLVPLAEGGIGYMAFSIAMTAGRLCGDAVAARFGDRNTLFWGGVIALAGFATLLTAPNAAGALAGFVLIGLGASNIVPVLFRRTAGQDDMPSGLAVAAMTTTGYAGILAGPAAIGFVAKLTGLQSAFWMLALLLCLVPLCARRVTAGRAR